MALIMSLMKKKINTTKYFKNNMNNEKTNKDERLTIRLTPHDKLKLDELQKYLNVSYSLLLRSIIQDFIYKNERTINNILDKCPPSIN